MGKLVIGVTFPKNTRFKVRLWGREEKEVTGFTNKVIHEHLECYLTPKKLKAYVTHISNHRRGKWPRVALSQFSLVLIEGFLCVKGNKHHHVWTGVHTSALMLQLCTRCQLQLLSVCKSSSSNRSPVSQLLGQLLEVIMIKNSILSCF